MTNESGSLLFHLVRTTWLDYEDATTLIAPILQGVADVIAIKPGQVLLVNCKRTTMPGPAERVQLLKVASCLPGVAVPLVALHPFRKPLTFRRLTGPGPKDWQPWSPDAIEETA